MKLFVHVCDNFLFWKECQIANFIEISTLFIFRVEFPKKGNRLHNFRVNQMCSLGQQLSKYGCMIMFGADFIEIFTV
jgi:hypothetical protein